MMLPNACNGWLLYGRQLDNAMLSRYQRLLNVALVIVNRTRVADYQIIRIGGPLPPEAVCLAHQCGMDVLAPGKIPQLTTPGLLVMDMDSTAIEMESIDELARLAGCGEAVAAITRRAMCGELDFTQSLRQRVAMLKGLPVALLRRLRDNMPLTPGLTRLVQTLLAHRWRVAIISGGFTFFADALRDKLHLSFALANVAEIQHGRLTGNLIGPIVDAQRKADALRMLAEKYHIDAEQTIAVGDGANDLPMLQAAALGIAFHAKPTVKKLTGVSICHADLTGILCILSSP